MVYSQINIIDFPVDDAVGPRKPILNGTFVDNFKSRLEAGTYENG